jgi:hypothetical protein
MNRPLLGLRCPFHLPPSKLARFPFHMEVDGGRMRLAVGAPARSLRSPILTRPTLGALSSPTQPTDCFAIAFPGRGLSQVSTASICSLQACLCCFLHWGESGNRLRLARGAWPCRRGRASDGEHCSKFRSDKVLDGTSCGAKCRLAMRFYPL